MEPNKGHPVVRTDAAGNDDMVEQPISPANLSEDTPTGQFFRNVMKVGPDEASSTTSSAYAAIKTDGAGLPLLDGRQISGGTMVTVPLTSSMLTKNDKIIKTHRTCNPWVACIGSLIALGALILAACLYLVFGNETVNDKLGDNGKMWLLSGTAGAELLICLAVGIAYCRSTAKVHPADNPSPGFG